MSAQTVFFGPFVGEFGWEFKFWQGVGAADVPDVVRRAPEDRGELPGPSRVLSGRRRILAAPEGCDRGPHLVARLHHRLLACGWPRPKPALREALAFGRRRWVKETIEAAGPVTDVEPQLVALLEEYRAAVPPDTTWFIPWRLNVIADDG